MYLMAQSQNSVEALRGLPMGIALIIALGASVAFTVLIWKLGVIRYMVNVQNERQKRFRGGGNLHGVEWGTDRNAALSFAGAIWLVSFCLILFGLIVYA